VDRRRHAEEYVGSEWADWYFLTPQERWRESSKLWESYLALGGTLEPEPDTQSPFFDAEERTADTYYWEPLRQELERLRRERRQLNEPR
jgi:hypothetical protein